MNTEKELTGYPSIDKPWLKYYSEEAINYELPHCSAYRYMTESNENYGNEFAINYFNRLITFDELNENIDKVAGSLSAYGIKKGDIITICSITIPEVEYKPAHFIGIPSHFEIMMDDHRLDGKDLSFIKNAGCGGDQVSSALEERTNKWLSEHNCKNMMRVGFGMTENAAMSIYNLNNGMTKVGRIGIPMQKTNIGVFDENGNELTYNKVGELRISSPAIINGYYKNEKETANIIIDVNGERWIKTGDYASIDEDGNVQIIGRKRAMFVRPDGHNVFPDLIRDYLSGCPIIKEVCVIGIKSRYNEHGKIPTAIVVLKDQNINVDEAKQKILEYQSHLLGERDGALDVRFRDELPLTPIGKIDVLRIEQEESINMSDIDFDTLIAKK